MQEVLGILKVLSDEIRLRIVSLLMENELCVCELMEALKMSQSRISNHLRVLRNIGIIRAKREGKWMFYSLANDTMDDAVLEIIQVIVRKINERDYLAREKALIDKLIPKRGKPGQCPIPLSRIQSANSKKKRLKG